MNLKNVTFAIITHVYATGPAFKLEEYLKDKTDNLIFIGHPFSYTKDTRSFMRVYKNGKLQTEKKFILWRGPEITFFVKDFFLTFWWVLRYKRNIDYFIAADNLNSFSGVILKLFGKAQKIIFYTIDYVPKRFENSILNSLYHFLDRFAVKHSYRVWNLSSRMVTEREKRGVGREFRKKQLTVPIGTDITSKPIPFKMIDKNKVVHMGHLIKKQGVELLINAMKDVVKQHPNAHLLIIGGGPLENKLKADVQKLKLDSHVKFTGFLEKFSDVQKKLEDGAIGVAPYVDDEKTYTRYTDPGKPKDYLASGLPVIITKVPEVAFEIERNKCGIAIEYNKKELVKAIVKLISDSSLLSLYRTNAIKMARKYHWKKVFSNALTESV